MKNQEQTVKEAFDLIADPLKVEFKGELNSNQQCIDPPQKKPPVDQPNPK
jgi:hypothetical protein